MNARLKTGEGWIGYRNGGASGLSKYLYFAYYPTPGAPQKFVNSKTNDVEDAYRQLLSARGASERGVMVLPSEAARITYEHIRDQYLADKPQPQKSKLGHLDKFFSRMKAVQITTAVIRQYIAKRRHVVTGPTIRRELVVLRAMFKLAGREKIMSQDQIPYFPMPDGSEAAGEYITPEQFWKVLAALPDGKTRGGREQRVGRVRDEPATVLQVLVRDRMPPRRSTKGFVEQREGSEWRDDYRDRGGQDEDQTSADATLGW